MLSAGVRAMVESSHPGGLPPVGSFVDDGGGAVLVTAVKGSEDPADGPGGADRVLEEDYGAHQIRTFRVPADPAAPVQEVDLVEWPLPGDPTR